LGGRIFPLRIFGEGGLFILRNPKLPGGCGSPYFEGKGGLLGKGGKRPELLVDHGLRGARRVHFDEIAPIFR